MAKQGSSRREKGRSEANPRRAAEEIFDPVCGLEVDSESAERVEHAGRVYFFCSEGCRKEFETTPKEYVV